MVNQMIERIPIASIRIGERRRQDLGDITSLARNIDQHGLLHPIIVAADGELIAGERRLRACESLGLSVIEARRWPDLSEVERREVELAENLDRKDLTSFEAARQFLAEAALKASNIAERNSVQQNTESTRGGHNKRADSQRARADSAGVSQTAIAEAEQYVKVAESYPAFQKSDWKQYHVLEAKEKLETLPESDRAEAVRLIGQPGIPPKDAIGIIGNLSTMEPEERSEVFRLAVSEDSRERDRALTTAARLPPMPDPRSTMLNRAVMDLKKAARLFPSDPMSPRIEVFIPALREIIAELDAAYQEVKGADAISRKVS